MFKVPFYLFLFLLLPFSLFGQVNLVPNPSFEQHDSCPNNQNQVRYAQGWNNFGESPDYFNSCSVNPQFSIPHNWGGFQQAINGNAYCAVGTYLSGIYGIPNIREYVGTQLFSPLSIGTKYFVSFKISLALDSIIQCNCATDHIGAMFSTIPYSWNNPAPKTNNPPVYSSTIITDSTGWTSVFGSFVADSNYQFIILGNFFDDVNTDTLIMDNGVYCDYAYYYLDDICVSTDSIFAVNYFTGIESTTPLPLISIYPNPAQDYFVIEGCDTPFDLIIYNTLGEIVFQQTNIPSATSRRINIRNIADGILLIRINGKNESFQYKLLKQ